MIKMLTITLLMVLLTWITPWLFTRHKCTSTIWKM